MIISQLIEILWNNFVLLQYRGTAVTIGYFVRLPGNGLMNVRLWWNDN